MVEALGIIATLVILGSMCFETLSVKGSLLMRSINIVGNLLLLIYAILIHSVSSGILGGGIILVNIFYIIKLWRQHRTTSPEA